MGRDYKAYGQTFLQGVLAKIGNADKRNAVEQLLNDPDVAAIIPDIGQGVFMQSDYSREMNEVDSRLKVETEKLRAHETALNDWWRVNEPTVGRYKKLVDEGVIAEDGTIKVGGTGTNRGTDTGRPAVDMRSVEELVSGREELAASFILEVNRLSTQHFKEFGEVLDTRQLVADAKKTGRILADVYAEQFKPRYDEKAKAAADARDNDIRRQEREKVLAEMAGSRTPYPVRGGADTSPLASLDVPSGQKGIDEAVEAYNQIVATRG